MSEKEYPTEDKAFAAGNDGEYPTKDNAQSHEPTAKNNAPAAAGDNADPAEANEPIEEGSEGPVKDEAAAPVEEKKGRDFKTTPGVLIFLICVFVAFVLCVAGMPIGMFDAKGDDPSCISIWGMKPKCLGTWFRHMDFENFRGTGRPCKKADSLIQGAQAFSVMCIIGGFLSVLVALLEVFNYAELAVVAGIMSCINTVATLVVWSTMTAMYWSNLCGTGVYADDYRMGNGLILFITAWCLQMVGNVALIIDIYLGNVK